jgi:hypothetical protein
MSKELNNTELAIEITDVAQDQVMTLDNLSLALIGGGDAPVAL